MKSLKVLFLALLLGAGCAQVMSTATLDSMSSVPEAAYTAYMFRSDAGEKLRVIFLRSPDSDVEVVPYSLQIATAKSTAQEALVFLEAEKPDYTLSIKSVHFNGKIVGYLLTSAQRSAAQFTEISLFARGGKIYFSISRPGY